MSATTACAELACVPRAAPRASQAAPSAADANRAPSDARLARFAVDALLEEAHLTPKPALVDRRGSGAHRDLDLAVMTRSALALEPTFEALARASRNRAPSVPLRAQLAQIGRAGEAAMMRATGGSNAHRGAIWIVGLLVAGATICGNVQASSAARICDLGAQIACFPDRFAPSADSNGTRVRDRYGVGGARREAQDGFPHVIGVGLPALDAARQRGVDENAARVDTLLAIMTSLDDTCLLHRAGWPALTAAKRGARRVLDTGGSSTASGRAELDSLERTLLALNASPGGAADLLAATLFIDKLVRHRTSGSPTTWNI
ncbi:triphosphoribosyl-dephospho-CoA synthase [Trinickia violacea]|uniref:Probable 2-(5''-triphosphoribosyl)-3'-dephosphocoenzyme-A synthase n=1 Tax=Trinickia violacea TaxID=2571746 RepID=A0A4P8J0K8_9BURK|nr:triphosphoribosyl-dephospho-CoA synthase [Trinickia violacea]QCP53865.1 triphosphoribosyl-dephospho-CoA synthase [Trinickia violacea]